MQCPHLDLLQCLPLVVQTPHYTLALLLYFVCVTLTLIQTIMIPLQFLKPASLHTTAASLNLTRSLVVPDCLIQIDWVLTDCMVESLDLLLPVHHVVHVAAELRLFRVYLHQSLQLRHLFTQLTQFILFQLWQHRSQEVCGLLFAAVDLVYFALDLVVQFVRLPEEVT